MSNSKVENVEMSEDIVDKKKRKLPNKSEIRHESKTNDKKLFYAEENEVLERDVHEDASIHKEVILELTSVMNKINNIKCQSNELTEEERKEKIEALKVDGIMQFISLRKLNRLGHFRCKRVREITHDAKQNIDDYHLKLQNLIYEVMHLQKEISKCLQFKSKDEDISLISVDEFLNSIDPDIAQTLRAEGDSHKLMLSRLDWELKKRLELSTKLTDSEARKKVILNEIESKKRYLKGLQPKLSSILEATKPVEQDMNLRFSETLGQQRVANNLPAPLYFLFVQASSYSRACDKNINVSIQGDIELAQSFDSSPAPIDDDSDSEDDLVEKKTKKHRRMTIDAKQTKKQQQIMKKHPLTVVIDIVCEDIGKIRLTFAYYVVLHVVTISAEVQLHDDKMEVDGALNCKSSSYNLFDSLSFLQCLYDVDDNGNDSPDPNNLFVLNKYGITHLPTHLHGYERPYKWVQRLCGLHMLTTSTVPLKNDSNAGSDDNDCGNGVAAVAATGGGGGGGGGNHGDDGVVDVRRTSYIENMVKLMKRRMKQRWHLFQQLFKLEKINPVTMTTTTTMTSVMTFEELLSPYKQKVICRLVEWKSMLYKDYVILEQNQHIVNCNLASDRDFYFTGLVERIVTNSNHSTNNSNDSVAQVGQHKVCLKFCVLIGSDYPVTPPLFSFLVQWKDLKRTATNDEAVREMECVVNTKMTSSASDVLINQIVGMCSCFDVYLETGGMVECCGAGGATNTEAMHGEGTNQQWRCLVNSQKTFLRIAKGPTRSKPYMFNSQLGFYSHY